jgi:hypothetical protein
MQLIESLVRETKRKQQTKRSDEMSEVGTLDGLEIERAEFVRLPEGPQVMMLEHAEVGERAKWDQNTNQPHPTERERVLKFRFAKKLKDKRAVVFADATLRFGPKAKLQHILRGLFGQERFEAIKGDNRLIQAELTAALGKSYMVSHEYYVSGKGTEVNKFLAVGRLPAELEQISVQQDVPPPPGDEDIPF